MKTSFSRVIMSSAYVIFANFGKKWSLLMSNKLSHHFLIHKVARPKDPLNNLINDIMADNKRLHPLSQHEPIIHHNLPSINRALDILNSLHNDLFGAISELNLLLKPPADVRVADFAVFSHKSIITVFFNFSDIALDQAV